MDDNGELLVALTDLEIARAELAAANTRTAELEGELGHAQSGVIAAKMLNESWKEAEAKLDRVTEALNRVDWWHHPGTWNDSCPGRPTRLHWTRPGQLEAKCSDCGFALVGMDADGVAIQAGEDA